MAGEGAASWKTSTTAPARTGSPTGAFVDGLLIVDDWAMAPMTELERRDFLEICDARYQTRSTLLTSQLPVASWHAQIGDPTIAIAYEQTIRPETCNQPTAVS